MIFNPHKLGLHKVLQYIPLGTIFDAPYKARLRKAVNIADLRLIAKARAHKVSLFVRSVSLLRSFYSLFITALNYDVDGL